MVTSVHIRDMMPRIKTKGKNFWEDLLRHTLLHKKNDDKKKHNQYLFNGKAKGQNYYDTRSRMTLSSSKGPNIHHDCSLWNTKCYVVSIYSCFLPGTGGDSRLGFK